jgi:hypothetical protein
VIDILMLLVAFLGLAALAFAGAVRLGMLVGRRLDRFIEIRASSGGPDGLAAPVAAASSAAPNHVAAENIYEQEDRGD